MPAPVGTARFLFGRVDTPRAQFADRLARKEPLRLGRTLERGIEVREAENAREKMRVLSRAGDLVVDLIGEVRPRRGGRTSAFSRASTRAEAVVGLKSRQDSPATEAPTEETDPPPVDDLRGRATEELVTDKP